MSKLSNLFKYTLRPAPVKMVPVPLERLEQAVASIPKFDTGSRADDCARQWRFAIYKIADESKNDRNLVSPNFGYLGDKLDKVASAIERTKGPTVQVAHEDLCYIETRLQPYLNRGGVLQRLAQDYKQAVTDFVERETAPAPGKVTRGYSLPPLVPAVRQSETPKLPLAL